MGNILSSIINIIPWISEHPYESVIIFSLLFIIGYGLWRRMMGIKGTSSWKGGIWELFNPEKRQIIENDAIGQQFYNKQKTRQKIKNVLSKLLPDLEFQESSFPDGTKIEFYNEEYRIAVKDVGGMDIKYIKNLNLVSLNLGVRLIQIPAGDYDMDHYIRSKLYS